MSAPFMKNIIAQLRALAKDDIFFLSGSGAPVDGASGTGVGLAGKGATYTDASTGAMYTNVGTKSSPVWQIIGGYFALSFTSTVVKALRATPQTLVAAPGAGKVLEFVSAELYLDYGGTNVFTESAANLAVKYNNGSGVQVSQTIESTGFIDQSADTRTVGLPKIDQIVAKTGCENLPLVLHNLGAGEIAGNAANDNVLRVRGYYAVHATGW